MRRLAAVLCQDAPSLHTLQIAFNEVGMAQTTCRSHQEAMELVLGGNCAALIVDFDLPRAAAVVRTAALLAPPYKPLLLAMAGVSWLGAGQAFQSGASRILYKPLQPEQVRDAFEPGRGCKKKNRQRAPRHEMRSLVYLELEIGAVPAIGIDIGEQGMAIRTAEQIMPRPNVAFRCILPGTKDELRGHADVVWADAQGRAGMFFSRLSPSVRRHLTGWLRQRGRRQTNGLRNLLPSAAAALFAAP